MGAHTSATGTGDVQAVLDGIRRIVQALHASSRHTERRVGLTAAQLFVLRSLAGTKGLSINELSARTFTHQSSVSVVASRLQRRGLVARRADPEDGRRRVITLTAAGRRALSTAPAATQERLIGAVVAMTPTLRRSAIRALDQIANAMVADKRPPMFLEGDPS
jgi:DNA-binding MarR family transcriptional regulator